MYTDNIQHIIQMSKQRFNYFNSPGGLSLNYEMTEISGYAPVHVYPQTGYALVNVYPQTDYALVNVYPQTDYAPVHVYPQTDYALVNVYR